MFVTQLEAIQQQAEKHLANMVEKFGEESEYSQEKVLKIEEDDLMFNLNDIGYLTEVAKDKLIDLYGNHYDLYSLPSHEFFQVVDYFHNKLY